MKRIPGSQVALHQWQKLPSLTRVPLAVTVIQLALADAVTGCGYTSGNAHV